MKNKLFTILILSGISILMNISKSNLYAQTDTVKIEYSEELKDSSDYNYKLKYKYLNYNLIEEKNLLTLDLVGLNYSYGEGSNIFEAVTTRGNSAFAITTGFSYERKISQAWAAGISNTFYYQKNGDYYKGFSYNTGIMVRYFYNKNKEINYNYSANNFMGNYLGVSIYGFRYAVTEYLPFPVNGSEPSKDSQFIFNPGITLSWGINTRINKYLLIDFAPFLGYDYNASQKRNDFQFGIRLKAAIGFGFN